MQHPALEVREVQAGYGPINVLWDVSAAARAGTTTTILGPNGAGKTTLLRAIMGLVKVRSGAIEIDGQPRTGNATWDMVRDGVILVPEGRLIFRDMTVEDNLLMGAYPARSRPRAASNLDDVYQLLPRLKERRRQLAGSLSGGEAQMVAIGRGLMEEPQIFLIDEPSLGLAPVVVDEIFAILRKQKELGRTIVLVEQNTHMALSLADHVYLMQSGRIILSRTAGEIDINHLHDLYFARETAT
ncbi:MAG: ABC transporter ATP-binding protein [Bradyrhizobiaceae bacterium]|nr:ABC transporter ATP-binding protein [Bradyrhizobiaceae bacterium]